MKTADTGDLWWKNAVFYCLDVETFSDSNADGVGDFVGLTDRIDYLADLGVTCVWLMPFHPSPNRDDGYDVTDFYGVDPRFGHPGDAAEFFRTARSRGIRVIVDLVVNHTSDQHPWFQAARSSRDSPYRDYYVWRDDPPVDTPNRIFPDEEDGMWQWDPQAGQFYLHTFYHHQPDLNLANSRVCDEIAKIMAFWLELGVAGFRIDAVPFLLDQPGAPGDTDPHVFLRDIKRFSRRRSSEAMLLGEVGLAHDEQFAYFGGRRGDELDAQFDFTMAEALFLALVRRDAGPLVRALDSRPRAEEPIGWVNFLRNHDELSLELLQDDEREEVFAALAPDPAQRVYGRGIVRRLAPMLGGDQRRIRLAYSLLFSLPGSPMLLWGEEIGMSENPALPGRLATRTPMQWSDDKGGGFTRADEPVRPFPAGPYGPDRVNVHDEQRDPQSLHHFIRRLAFRYRSTPEIGWGHYDVLAHDVPGVLVHAMTGPPGLFVAAHNFTDEPVTFTVELPEPMRAREFDELLSPEVYRPGERRLELSLEPYGFRWLRARGEAV